MDKNKIETFTDLKAWQESRKLVKEVYKLTNKFPSHEKFGLKDQCQRAVVSIPSHITEG